MTDTMQLGTLEHVDPQQVTVEQNTRSTAALSREFVASIRQNGVLTPILARRDPDGQVIVRAGQRRTLAAREAGLASIPAYIVDADDTTVDRIVQQMAENDHRDAVSDADRAAAFQQLAFEGLSPAVIAKRTGTKAATVKAALAVADSAVAASAIQAHSLTLDQAATLIEFDGHDQTVDHLIEVATTDPAQFAHAAQRVRDELARTQAKTAIEADLTDRGFTILDHAPGYYDTDYTHIRELVTADGHPVTPGHLTDALGRAAYVRVYNPDDPDVSYYVADVKASGFTKPNGSGAASGPMTDEQKTERRALITNNKAWASAETVRRHWLTELLTRKSLPKDTGRVVVDGLTVHRGDVGRAITDRNELAHQLLGLERPGYFEPDKLAALVAHSPARTQHVTLAIVLGGIEASTSKETWRYPHATKAAYFRQLAAWGYNLSRVEQILIDAFPATDPDSAASVAETPDDNPETTSPAPDPTGV